MAEDADFTTEVVVVGSGVAGGLVANELAKAGLDVICLEAGPPIDRNAAVNRYRNSVTHDWQSPYVNTEYAPHPSQTEPGSYIEEVGPNNYGCLYIRGVGGTTWHWSAECWRYTPEELKEKSTYGVGRDMPLTYEELEPYYDRAEAELGVAGDSEPMAYMVDRRTSYPMRPIPLGYYERWIGDKLVSDGLKMVSAPVARNSAVYDGRPQCCGNGNCMPICPIGAMYSGDIHIRKAERQPKPARLISRAVVDFIRVKTDGSVEAVAYVTPDGSQKWVAAKYFVLAANGIETPKLMLLSRQETAPNGVGNASDQVGRNLMDHPGISASFLAPEPVYSGRGPEAIGRILKYRQGDFKSEHAGFRLNFYNRLSPETYVDQALKEGRLGQQLSDRVQYLMDHVVNINAFLGQLPEQRNRVTLSELTDRIGLARPKIDYSVGPWTFAAAEACQAEFEKIAKMCGGTNFTPGTSPFNRSLRPENAYGPNNHMMGTTIMGETESDSVVDKDCKVFGHDNLYVASSSVQSFTGVVNPTLTIAAFAIRIADTLKARLSE